mmetsp:Transcript_57908/g.154763  ORF Transcript_57908/g.154763 Transcript_57908/m.154763 type:complete len:208 (+) Transcript_57908:656-1279(+)
MWWFSSHPLLGAWCAAAGRAWLQSWASWSRRMALSSVTRAWSSSCLRWVSSAASRAARPWSRTAASSSAFWVTRARFRRLASARRSAASAVARVAWSSSFSACTSSPSWTRFRVVVTEDKAPSTSSFWVRSCSRRTLASAAASCFTCTSRMTFFIRAWWWASSFSRFCLPSSCTFSSSWSDWAERSRHRCTRAERRVWASAVSWDWT